MNVQEEGNEINSVSPHLISWRTQLFGVAIPGVVLCPALHKSISAESTQEEALGNMNAETNAEIIGEICEYSLKYEIKEMLGEYLKRLVMNKPDEPLKFLLRQIQENPFPIASATPMAPGPDKVIEGEGKEVEAKQEEPATE